MIFHATMIPWNRHRMNTSPFLHGVVPSFHRSAVEHLMKAIIRKGRAAPVIIRVPPIPVLDHVVGIIGHVHVRNAPESQFGFASAADRIITMDDTVCHQR